MSESKLSTAAYFEQAQQADAAAAEAARSTGPSATSHNRWERATSLFSLMLAGALAISLAGLAILFLASGRDGTDRRAKKATHPIDWLLRLGGAKPGQTFERYITDSVERSEREFDDIQRASPIYKLKSQPIAAPIRRGPNFDGSPRRAK